MDVFVSTVEGNSELNVSRLLNLCQSWMAMGIVTTKDDFICFWGMRYERGLISLWLYKENNKLGD
jgi:hypothetical protein